MSGNAANTVDPANTNQADILQAVAPKDIDLGGDVSLIFGVKGCQVRIKAQKALLSMVSNYFRALFSQGFSEGSKPASEALELDEDEPDAIVSLMAILHMRYTGPMPMTTLEIVSLAVVTDKYDCVKAVRLSLDALFPAIATDMSATDMVRLAVAAYLLDYPGMFTKATLKLITYYRTAIPQLVELDIAQRIPFKAWLLIQSQREEAWIRIVDMMSKLMSRPCEAEFKNCVQTKQWYSTLTRNIRLLGLDVFDISCTCLYDFMQSATRLQVPATRLDLSCCRTGYAPPPAPYKSHPEPMTQAAYDVKLAAVQSACSGLCLDCVKAGGVNSGKCRIKHAWRIAEAFRRAISWKGLSTPDAGCRDCGRRPSTQRGYNKPPKIDG